MSLCTDSFRVIMNRLRNDAYEDVLSRDGVPSSKRATVPSLLSQSDKSWFGVRKLKKTK